MPKQKEKLMCAGCGDCCEDSLQSYLVDNEDIILCESCYENDTHICNECDGVFRDCIEEFDTANGCEYICDGCCDNLSQCRDCGVYITDDCNSHSLHNGELCERCFEGNYFYCERCDEVFHNDHYCGDGYCRGCYGDDEVWDCTPVQWAKYDTSKDRENEEKLYFGVELEVGFDDNPGFDELCSNKPSWLYHYSDPSVGHDYNVEWLVSPMTWNYIRENSDAIKKFLNKNLNFDGVEHSHNAGMHIHLSKDAFNGYKHIYKFFRMIHNNIDYFYSVSGRCSEENMTGWAKFVPLQNRRNSTDEMKDAVNRISKHSAVNTSHSDTLEVRFFASTLVFAEYMKNISILYHLFNFTKDYDFDDMDIEKFKTYMEDKNNEA